MTRNLCTRESFWRSTIVAASFAIVSCGNESPPETVAAPALALVEESASLSKLPTALALHQAPLFPNNLFRAGERIPVAEIGAPFDAPGAFPMKATLLNGVFNEAQPAFHAEDSTIEFPTPGLYFAKAGGEEKVFLAFGEDMLTNADLAFAAVAIFADGGSDDIAEFSAAPRQTLQALLDDPKDVSWNCGIAAAAMRLLLKSMEIDSRLVQWVGPPSADGQTCDAHQNLEVYLSGYGGWTLYDPHFGVAMKPGFSSLDAFETFNRVGSVSPYIRLYRREAPWHREPWRFIADYNWAVGVYDDNTNVFAMTPKAGFTLDQEAVSPCVSKYELQPDRDKYRAEEYGAIHSITPTPE